MGSGKLQRRKLPSEVSIENICSFYLFAPFNNHARGGFWTMQSCGSINRLTADRFVLGVQGGLCTWCVEIKDEQRLPKMKSWSGVKMR